MLLLLSLLLLPTLTSSLPTRHITAASVDHFIDGETIQAGRWVAHDAAAPSSSKHPAYGVGIEFEREKIAALSEGERGAGAGWGHSSSAPASAANHLEVCPLGSQRCKVWEPEVMTDGGGRGPLVERFECINPETSISHCGGCLHAPSSASLAPPLPSADDREAILAHHGPWGGGTNCSAIPGVQQVACTFGRCIIDHCQPGWAFNRPEMRCEHIDDPTQEGYLPPKA